MSGSAKASPAPLPAPITQPILVPAGPKKGAIWRIIALVAVVALAAGWWVTRQQQAAARPIPIRTVRAQRGPLEVSRRVAGTIAAGRFINISAPVLTAAEGARSGMELIYLVEGGTLVKEGDLIARIDPQALIDHLDDVISQVAQADLELLRRRATQAADMEAMEQRVRVAAANLEKALLDERTAEVKPKIAQELLHLGAAEARAIYEELATEVPLTAERQAHELNVFQISRDRQARHRDRHQNDLKRYEIKAPMSGLAVLMTLNRNGEARQIQVGEQLNPGQPILRVVDPKSMLLDGTINQAESEMFRLGQRAAVHFDAYPNIHVRGKVRAVGAMAITTRRSSNYIRRIPLSIALDEQVANVIPDLSASADVTVDEEASALLIPRQSIGVNGGKSVVYVKQATGEFEPREVQVGATNSTHASIVAGLTGAEEIALQAMND